MNETAVERLLHMLNERPADAPRLIGRATSGADAAAVRDALGADPRFAPSLHRLCQDPRLLDQVKWVVQFLGRQRYEPAVPALLDAWTRRSVGLSDQAGRAIIAIGNRAGTEALSADLGRVRGLLAAVALEAAVALGGMFGRVAPLLDEDAVARDVLGFLRQHRDVFEADARWRSFAESAIRTRSPDVARAAQSLLGRVLSKRELARLLGERAVEGPSWGARPGAALTRARDMMRELRDGLDRGAWSAPDAQQEDRLAAIEAIVGPLPAVARALYETMDGIHVDAAKPADRFVVYPLREAHQAAHDFNRQHAPRTTPRDLVPPFLFPVAPDGYEKAGYSGGPPIGFGMPCEQDDPRLSNLSRSPRLSTFVRRSRRVPGGNKKKAPRPR